MPEFLPECVEKVKAKNGQLCSWDNYCKIIQDNTDIYCKNRKNQDGTPFSEPVPAIENGKPCYCCCSCLAHHTPVEVKLGEFVPIVDIQPGDVALAASLAPDGIAWDERVVWYSSGIGPNLDFDFMYYVQYLMEDDSQQIICTFDHLLLMESGKVKPVQYIKAGDRLQRRDGGVCEVAFVIVARYVGGVHHIAFDGFDNTTLDGHLVSSNGVVSADYAVQLAYSAGQLNPNLIEQSTEENPPRVGTPEYSARYDNPACRAFLADNTRWPSGLDPIRTGLVNVPHTAMSYFTTRQAEELGANRESYPNTTTINLATTRWLFNIYGSFYPKLVFLVDWENPLPNVYAWDANGQRIVLVTGGLALIKGLTGEGLAMLVAHGVSAIEDFRCVGPADYHSVFFVMRSVWADRFFENYLRGLEQVKMLFAAIEDNGADPDDICRQPSLACRIATYEAAGSLFNIPGCALPETFFHVVGARSDRTRSRVRVIFDRAVDVVTAEEIDNYTIGDLLNPNSITIVKAEVRDAQPDSTWLQVEGLERKHTYEVKVQRVQSVDGVIVDPGESTATFSTL